MYSVTFRNKSIVWFQSKEVAVVAPVPSDLSTSYNISETHVIEVVSSCSQDPDSPEIQVNLSQKHLFLHQLTHNMTQDCSLIYQFCTWKQQAQNMLCTFVILWANWCKNKCFWKRFTCMTCFSKIFVDIKVQLALIAIHNASFFTVKEGFSPRNFCC